MPFSVFCMVVLKTALKCCAGCIRVDFQKFHCLRSFKKLMCRYTRICNKRRGRREREPSKPSRLCIRLASELHAVMSAVGQESIKWRHLLRVNLVRLQAGFAKYSRLCSRTEEPSDEGTRAQNAESTNDGLDAIKTRGA